MHHEGKLLPQGMGPWPSGAIHLNLLGERRRRRKAFTSGWPCFRKYFCGGLMGLPAALSPNLRRVHQEGGRLLIQCSGTAAHTHPLEYEGVKCSRRWLDE
jgi:hypothetical protein